MKVNGGAETVQVVGGGDSVVLEGFGGANTFEVVSTVAGVLFALHGGASADTFNVTAAGLDANTLKGAVNISGGAGADTLFYDDNYFNPAVGPTIDVVSTGVHRQSPVVACLTPWACKLNWEVLRAALPLRIPAA